MKFHFDTARYLAAKKAIDDRSLNAGVWNDLVAAVGRRSDLSVLEIGGGIGTMLERLVDRELLCGAHYRLVDRDGRLLEQACYRLTAWAEAGGRELVWKSPVRAVLTHEAIEIELVESEVFDHLAACRHPFDLVIAHAFLDLVDSRAIVERLGPLLMPGSLLYFTLNFDGETLLLPEIDHHLDQRIVDLYHASMDERRSRGRRAGDRHTGRHLLVHLREFEAELVAAGSSDWFVLPIGGSYADEGAYFLRYLLANIAGEMERCGVIGHHEMDRWLAERENQIERGELIFIAKQLDVLARWCRDASGAPN